MSNKSICAYSTSDIDQYIYNLAREVSLKWTSRDVLVTEWSEAFAFSSFAIQCSFQTPSFLFCVCLIEGIQSCIAKTFLSVMSRPASVAQLDAPSDWRPGGRGFNPRRGRQHSFVEIDHEIFSTVILSLPLIQEGQLSVSGERMCTILVNRLED